VSAQASPVEFGFAFDPRYLRVLWLLGVTPRRSWVSIDQGRFEARFGPWRLQTQVANIDCTEISGPYRAHRVIGPHISLADRGLSFGSNIDRGVCLRFRDPVPGPETLGLVHHPALTVTVADIDGLVAEVERARDVDDGPPGGVR
jgi:hypothetical protein